MAPLSGRSRALRLLTWNLFHGRSVPPARVDLSSQFAASLSRWSWDVALLQEVPPWWPAMLAAASGARALSALTSRNALLPIRRAIATARPDLAKSNGGGANAILLREPAIPATAAMKHRSVRLRLWPERRVAQLVRLCDGLCVVNFHGSSRAPLAERELQRLWSIALAWSGGAALVLGGDLNLRRPEAPDRAIIHVARRDVDHIFVRGLSAVGASQQLSRSVQLRGSTLELSDHPPLLVELRLPAHAPLRAPHARWAAS